MPDGRWRARHHMQIRWITHMIVWVLIVKIMISAPVAPKQLPYLAFNNQDDCEDVRGTLPHDAKSICVAFAADKTDDD